MIFNKDLSFNRFYPRWDLASLSRKIFMLKAIFFEFTFCKLNWHDFPGLWAGKDTSGSYWEEDCYCKNCGHMNPNFGRRHYYS